MPELPLLPAMGVGSYAAPGWFIAARRLMREDKWGAHDIEELLDDATRIVVADQLEAGVDVITDGELRRQRFVYEMYDRITGLERVPPRRRLGVPGYDRAPGFVASGPHAAPEGFGVVEDFAALLKLHSPTGNSRTNHIKTADITCKRISEIGHNRINHTYKYHFLSPDILNIF